MKHFTLFVLLLSSLLCSAQPAASDYNINVHVSESRLVPSHCSLDTYQSLVVTIDGKKYELESLDNPNALLTLGDYKARLARDQQREGPYDSYRVYEFLLPSNNKKRQFVIVGQFE